MKNKQAIILLVVLFLGLGSALFSSGMHFKKPPQEDVGFVYDAVVAFSKDWNPDELLARAEPGSMASDDQKITYLFNTYRKLGPLTAPPSCHDSKVLYRYVCSCKFKTGNATLFFSAKKGNTDASWKIYTIDINSSETSESK